jgi:hypothetical protein
MKLSKYLELHAKLRSYFRIFILNVSQAKKNRHQILQDLKRSYTYKIFRTIVSQDWTISQVFIFSKILSDSAYKIPAKILQDSDIKKRIQLDCMILV